jgi:hypothetical protein
MSTRKMPVLDIKIWRNRINEYIIAKATKREAERAARAADDTVKAIRAELYSAMNRSPAAICGNAALTVKLGAEAPAKLTLTTGETVLWSDVTSVLAGNRVISRDEIQTLFGGRCGSFDIEVTGQP